MLALLFALLEVAAAADPAALPAGRLCIGETKSVLTRGDCRDVEGTSLTIEAADRERLFLWISADNTTAQIGTVPAKSTAIDLKTGKLSDMHATITASRGWPSDPKITVAAGAHRWEWALSGKLKLVIVPRGVYSIRIDAEHHRPAMIRRADASGDAVKLTPLTIHPLPQLKGRVIDKDNMPVPGAQISFTDGEVCAVTNVQGEFSCELTSKPRPERLVVTSAGLAARELPFREGTNRDTDLGDIRLLPGRPLIVNITKPDELMKVKVTLLYDSPKEHEHSHVRTVELPAGEKQVTFDEVTAGDYHLLLQGAGPAERLVVPVEIKDEETVTKEITIEPFRLEGTARLGEKDIDGTLNLSGPEMSWSGTVPIKDGTFETTMWQAGRLAAFLSAPALPQEEFVLSPELGHNPTKWDIRIPHRLITGRVFDADTKGPVPDAELNLVAELDGSRSYRILPLAPDGTFEVLAAKPGLYTLKVTSPKHPPSSTEVRIGPEDKSRNVDIPLETGVEQAIEVLTPAGTPVADFMVLEGVQSDGVNPKVMLRGRNGAFSVRGTPGEHRLVYLVPRDGSFAVVRLQLPTRGTAAKPMQVVVPPAAGALRVRVTDPDDKPLAGGILIRYNGEFLPGAISRFVTGDWVGTPPSGEAVIPRLPAGTYELWANLSHAEESEIIASGGSLRPPVRVGLAGGEQAVALVAPRRAPRTP